MENSLLITLFSIEVMLCGIMTCDIMHVTSFRMKKTKKGVGQLHQNT